MNPRNTDIERKIYEFVNRQIERFGINPSYREIAESIGRSVATVSKYLKRMESEGMLALNGKHGVSTKRQRADTAYVPIVGTVACGVPNFAEESIEAFFPILRNELGSGEYFALHASGDSMINAGIDVVDLVFVRKTFKAYDGDIVVALVEDSTTLKRYYDDTENRRIILHPENPKYKDMVFKDVTVQGVAVKVLKSL